MSSFLVTGAARGIGLEFVKQLSSHSDNTVFALVRNSQTSTNLSSLGRQNVHIIEADVTDLAAVSRAASSISQLTGGKLDMLINNAAHVQTRANQMRTLLDYTENAEDLEEQFMASFRVNVVGVVNTTNAFLPLLRAGHMKKVVTLSSGRGDLAFSEVMKDASAVPYGVSKCAVNFVVAKYAMVLKAEGFTFLTISPGMVATDGAAPSTPEQVEKFKTVVKAFQAVYPEWDGKPITTETSVKMMLDVAEKAGVERSGEFLSHHGNQRWL